jgi:hypothetical protein
MGETFQPFKQMASGVEAARGMFCAQIAQILALLGYVGNPDTEYFTLSNPNRRCPKRRSEIYNVSKVV